MSQLQLKSITKDIIDHAEKAMVPQAGLAKVVDDYLIQRFKEDELSHAQVDPKIYDGLRTMVKVEIVPLFARYLAESVRFRERKLNRKLWRYVLGTVAVLELLEALFSRGRSLAPQVLIPTGIFYAFLGFILYTAAQYLDDRHLVRARHRLERSIEGLDRRVQTDVAYDNRRQLLDTDVLRAEALELLAHYERPEDFWRDYRKVREADPTTPAAVQKLRLPAFERFLKFHVDGLDSALAREQRINRLFLEAQEAFVNRDRARYVLDHLKHLPPSSS